MANKIKATSSVLNQRVFNSVTSLVKIERHGTTFVDSDATILQNLKVEKKAAMDKIASHVSADKEVLTQAAMGKIASHVSADEEVLTQALNLKQEGPALVPKKINEVSGETQALDPTRKGGPVMPNKISEVSADTHALNPTRAETQVPKEVSKSGKCAKEKQPAASLSNNEKKLPRALVPKDEEELPGAFVTNGEEELPGAWVSYDKEELPGAFVSNEEQEVHFDSIRDQVRDDALSDSFSAFSSKGWFSSDDLCIKKN